MVQPYDTAIEQKMKLVFEQLSEKDRRLYAAVETLKLPWGGQTYLAEVLGCDAKTIRRGLADLQHPEHWPAAPRVRHAGGGRKRLVNSHPDLAPRLREVLETYTAGDPMKAEIHWTNLTPQQISPLLSTAELEVSPYVVEQLLALQDYRKRRMRKDLPTGTCADRNQQFQLIRDFRGHYTAAGNPVLSMDTKKKENLGLLYRAGAI
jgi:hypothetical protein